MAPVADTISCHCHQNALRQTCKQTDKQTDKQTERHRHRVKRALLLCGGSLTEIVHNYNDVTDCNVTVASHSQTHQTHVSLLNQKIIRTLETSDNPRAAAHRNGQNKPIGLLITLLDRAAHVNITDIGY